MREFCHAVLLLTALFSCNAVRATDWQGQRQQFRDAYEYLESGDMAAYHQAAKGLEQYPLYPYLRYVYMKKNMALAGREQINQYLSLHYDTRHARLLRRQWLRYLAEQEQWQAFLQAYTPQDDIALQCYFNHALLQSGGTIEQVWYNGGKEIWLTGKSQPKICDPLFEQFAEAGFLTPPLYLERARLATRNKNFKLAAYFLNQTGIDIPERDEVAKWRQMHREPEDTLKNFTGENNAWNRDMLIYGLQRLAKKDVDSAHTHWLELKSRYAFTPQEQGEMERFIALRGAWQDHPQAHTWLAEVKPEFHDRSLRVTQLRQYLLARDWKTLLKAMNSYPKAVQNQAKWRYWRARALEENGYRPAALVLFRQLAEIRDYYGFLAADRAGIKYNLLHRTVKPKPGEIDTLFNQSPGLIRAREFFCNNLLIEARREWNDSIANFSKRELELAASLVKSWGWYERAIFVAAKAGFFDDLEMRFPLLFQAGVQMGAEEQELDSAWIYGIIRQESAFTPDVRSSAGALGLMQLLPSTAKTTARRLGMDTRSISDTLLEPHENIRLGSSYLKQMLDSFDDNYMLASAAYNAGPTRVGQWLKSLPCVEADIWVEIVPYRETRQYIRRVLEYTVIFEHRMGRKTNGLRLRSVTPEQCGKTA